jgi:F-type H+-transporting ATPase subunit epsilon
MIHFELVSLTGKKFSDSVHEVMLPTPGGYIAVFRHHAPLVSIATQGIISIRHKENHPDDMLEHFATNGGVIEIADNTVRVLVDEADSGEDVNEEEIKEALERAKQLRAEAKDQVSLDKAQQLIDRSTVRLKVADLKRRKRRQ